MWGCAWACVVVRGWWCDCFLPQPLQPPPPQFIVWRTVPGPVYGTRHRMPAYFQAASASSSNARSTAPTYHRRRRATSFFVATDSCCCCCSSNLQAARCTRCSQRRQTALRTLIICREHAEKNISVFHRRTVVVPHVATTGAVTWRIPGIALLLDHFYSKSNILSVCR